MTISGDSCQGLLIIQEIPLITCREDFLSCWCYIKESFDLNGKSILTEATSGFFWILMQRNRKDIVTFGANCGIL